MCSYFTGAVYVDGSSIVLKGETVFANNTAISGGMSDKCTLRRISGNQMKCLNKYIYTYIYIYIYIYIVAPVAQRYLVTL